MTRWRIQGCACLWGRGHNLVFFVLFCFLYSQGLALVRYLVGSKDAEYRRLYRTSTYLFRFSWCHAFLDPPLRVHVRHHCVCLSFSERTFTVIPLQPLAQLGSMRVSFLGSSSVFHSKFLCNMANWLRISSFCSSAASRLRWNATAWGVGCDFPNTSSCWGPDDATWKCKEVNPLRRQMWPTRNRL